MVSNVMTWPTPPIPFSSNSRKIHSTFHILCPLTDSPMEELRSSPPPPTSVTTAASGRRREESAISRMKRGCLSFTTSVQESFYYVKATIVGQAKKLTARNEKEATEADLQAAKMQVEATDSAEDTKKRLDKSN